MARKKANTQPLWRFLFLIYLAMMLWLLFGRSSGWSEGQDYSQLLQQNMNLKPLHTIRSYLNIVLHYPQSSFYPHCVINLAGNVLMFIPAGWLLPRVFKPLRNFFLFALVCTLSILLVEVLQLFTLLGSFDVDDIILNLSGMLVGFILFAIFGKKK